MTDLVVDGLCIIVSHTADFQDDSETLEFWAGPGHSSKDLLAGVTALDPPGSPLRILVPNELDWGLLTTPVEHAKACFTQNRAT